MVSKRMALKWKIAAMVFAIAALNYADRTAIASVFPLLRAELGITDAVIAGIGSLFLWSYAIGSPFAGYIGRSVLPHPHRDHQPCGMERSHSTHVTGSQLLSPAGHARPAGLTECAYLPAAIALLAEHHGPETRATAMGFHIAGMNLGLIGGSALAGYLGQQLGWRMDFVVLGGFGFVLAIWLCLYSAMLLANWLKYQRRPPVSPESCIYSACRPTSPSSSAQC